MLEIQISTLVGLNPFSLFDILSYPSHGKSQQLKFRSFQVVGQYRDCYIRNNSLLPLTVLKLGNITFTGSTLDTGNIFTAPLSPLK